MAKQPKTKSTRQSKTAVVVIHGIGEQRPLGTIKEFVETVYQRDRTLASKPLAEGELLGVPIVPDSSTGSSELRRLTTLADGPGKRTDFFEFYWADIMDGTPVDMVTGWIKTLLLRSPWHLPKALKVRIAWLALCVVVAIIALAGVVALLAGPIEGVAPVKAALDWFSEWRFAIAGLLVALALAIVFGRAHRAGLVMRDVKLSRPFYFALFGVAIAVVPPELATSLRFWAGAFTVGVTWFVIARITPFVGDIARYVRATPSTIERRQKVRERGMQLLETLHGKRLDREEVEEKFTQSPSGDKPLYDRIVIVGHSLGTIIAYDLLQLFWEKHGPTHHQKWQPDGPGVQEALLEIDKHVQIAWGDNPLSFSPANFWTAQKTLYDILHAEAPRWRISDLITLGSPLTHAEFLLADSEKEVLEALEERRFAACPPRPDPMRKGSMLFPTKEGSPLYPHFAAQFAAVRWTNIFDHEDNPVLGDLISGPLAGVYGPGIAEHGLAIEKPDYKGWRRRLFTHTHYWKWHASYDSSAANIAAAATESDPEKKRDLLWHNVPNHIRELRLALRLGT